MKKYYLTVLLLMFSVIPFVQATNVRIVPKDQYEYDLWQSTYNNPLTFLVTVSDVRSAGSISFSFTQVSSWSGIYMNKNSDIEIENSRPDLRFYASDQLKEAFANVDKAREGKELPDGLPPLPPGATRDDYNPVYVNWIVPEDGSTATFSWTHKAYVPPNGFTIKITVKSKDGGSFGILQASFNGGNATINIPKDDNGDYIADSWERGAWVNGRHTPPADAETGPVTGNGVEKNTKISGDGQATLYWSTPSSSGSSSITHYEYRYAIDFSPGNYNFTTWTSMGSATTSYTVTGLTNGKNHFFQIRAVNGHSLSTVSNNVFVTPQTP